MTEATWGDDTLSLDIDWRMSAALQNVLRGDTGLAEVTSLGEAVTAWRALDPEHRAAAVLTPEHPITIEGVTTATLTGDSIAILAGKLPATSNADFPRD